METSPSSEGAMVLLCDNNKLPLAKKEKTSDSLNNEAIAGTSKTMKENNDPSTRVDETNPQVPIKPTVIRLKRRIEDNPSKILVVSFKRPKVDNSSVEESVSTEDANSEETNQICSRVLKLVGTISGNGVDEESIRTAVKNVIDSPKSLPESKSGYRQSVKSTHYTQITTKVRQRFKKSLDDGRFKLVNFKRGLNELDDDGKRRDGWEGQKELLQLLDLVPEKDSSAEETKIRVPPKGFEPGNITCNGIPMVKEKNDNGSPKNDAEDGFVYDLYMVNDIGVDDFYQSTSGIVSVEKGFDELDFGEYRDNADEDCLMDDDDSNAEDNWRNDYPDSEEGGSGDDLYGGAGRSCRFRYDDEGASSGEEMYGNLGGLKIKDASSSDDDLIYGIDDDGGNYTDGMNFEKRYARYKRNVQNEFADEVVSISSEDD